MMRVQFSTLLKVAFLSSMLMHAAVSLTSPSKRTNIHRDIPSPEQRAKLFSRLQSRKGDEEIKSRVSSLTETISKQYKMRLAADKNFISKSITEVLLAAGTQLAAEVNRRGARGLMSEIDFVVAGLLTAIIGKYYSMWRVAPVLDDQGGRKKMKVDKMKASVARRINVPNNAFQTDDNYMLHERCMAFILPIPSLFKAGFIASSVGYGLTAVLVAIRSWLVPSYVAATVNVNVLYASVYTGAFMALISNIRYQLLQGIIEPLMIEKMFASFPVMKATAIFWIRLGNGLLGSTIAIAGMKYFGLQKLK
jgi:hypothetical protein